MLRFFTIFLLVFTIFSPFTQLFPTEVLAQSTTPLSIASSIRKKSGDTYIATFAVTNSTRSTINLSGTNNTFSPGKTNRNQPRQFTPGTDARAFVIELNCEETLTWTLRFNSQNYSSTAESPRCGTVSIGEDGTRLSESRCAKPTGWIEDTTRRNDAYTKFYWVPLANTTTTQTPQTNPDAFAYKSCTSSNRVQYQQNGKWETIDNTVVARKVGQYDYTNAGNSYQVFFAAQPGKGFRFVSSDGEEVVVRLVQIAGKELQTKTAPILTKTTLTYAEVLPGVDLKYTLNIDGIAKEIVIKNARGLANELSSIDFILANRSLKKTNSVQEKINTEIKTDSLIAASSVSTSTLDALVVSKDSQEKSTQDVTQKSQLSQEKSRLLTLKNRIAEFNKARQQTSWNIAELTRERTKLRELADPSDRIIDQANKIEFGTPIFYDADDQVSQGITFSVSSDGRTISLYPETSMLKAQGQTFPLVIDPAITGHRIGTTDAWVDQWSPTARRGDTWGNRFHLAVGSNPCIWTTGGCYMSGMTNSYLGFDNPVTAGLKVTDARLSVWKYGTNGGGWSAAVERACANFDEWSITYNNQPWGCGWGTKRIWFNGNNNQELATSENISNLIPGDGSRILLMLQDWEGRNARLTRGAVFCSKDTYAAPGGHPCVPWQTAPYLDIWYNLPPRNLGLNKPVNNSENNQTTPSCNLSGTTATGNCNWQIPVNYEFRDVNDGEPSCVDANAGWYTRTRTWANNMDGNFFFTQNGPEYGQCRTVNRTYTLPNNVYLTTVRGNDRIENSSGWSEFNTYTVDTSAPTQTTFPKLPEFTNQFATNVPVYGDNTYERYALLYDPIVRQPSQIVPALATSAQLGFDAATSQLAVKTSPTAQSQFFVDTIGTNTVIRWNNDRTLCVTFASTNGQAVVLAPCDARSTQTVSITLQGQIKMASADRCLMLEQGRTQEGSRVLGTACNNLPNQVFDVKVMPFKVANDTRTMTGYEFINWGGNNTNGYELQLHGFTGQQKQGTTGGLTTDYEDFDARTRGTNADANFWREALYSIETNQLARIWNPLANSWRKDAQGQDRWYPAGKIRTIQGGCFDTDKPTGVRTRLQNWACNENPWQTFALTELGEIVTPFDGKCLDMNGITTLHGGVINVAVCNGSLTQRFSPVKMPKSEVFNQTLSGSTISGKYGLNILSGVYEAGKVGNLAKIFPKWSLSYNWQVRKVGETVWRDTCWGESAQLQLPNYTCATFNPLTNQTTTTSVPFVYQNGDTIETSVRTSDRQITGTTLEGNISPWYNLGTTTIDTSLPQVKNLVIRPTVPADYQGKRDTNGNPVENDSRFSPFVAGTDTNLSNNKKDALSISFTVKDNAAALARVRVVDSKGVTVATLTDCTVAGITAPCSYSNQTFSPTGTVVNFVWNGLKSDGTRFEDGKYDLQPQVFDRTCDLTNLLQPCNVSTPATGDNFVVVDSTTANIGISQIVNSGWTNQQPFVLNGGIAGFNHVGKEDRDFAQVCIALNGTTERCSDTVNNRSTTPDPTRPSINDVGNFSYAASLQNGANTFGLRAVDLAWNQSSRIGDHLQNPISSWVVNFDNETPTLVSQGFATTSTSTNPAFRFILNDTNKGAAPAGLTTGANATGYDLTLFRKQEASDPWNEVKLMQDGVITVDANQTTKLLGSFTCVLNVQNQTECTATLNRPQLDGLYRVQLTFRDRAGNQTVGSPFDFTVKTRVALRQDLPGVTSYTTGRDTQQFSGTIERGATLVIENQTLLRRISHQVTETASLVPQEFTYTGATQTASPTRVITTTTNPLTITCSGTRIDDDSNPETPTVEICSWTYTALQTVTATPALNTWQVRATDSMNNTRAFNTSITTNAGAITVISDPDMNTISPNVATGINRVTFSNSARDTNNNSVSDIVRTRLTIRNSTNTIVNESTINGALPPTMSWNGTSQTGVIVPDGNYTATLTITRLLNATEITMSSTPQTIQVITSIPTGSAPTISTPRTNSATTRGVYSVQGLGPATTPNISWNIEVCVHKSLEQSGPDIYDAAACAAPDYKTITATNSIGAYSIIVATPNPIAGRYLLTVRAVSSTGLVSAVSSPTLVTLDTSEAIRSAQLVPSLDGINTAVSLQDYANAVAGSSLSKLRTLQINTTVSRSTEFLEIDFVTYDNVGRAAGSPVSVFKDSNRIATINETRDTNTVQRNTANDPRIKRDLAQIVGTTDLTRSGALLTTPQSTLQSTALTQADRTNFWDARNNSCQQEQCDWNFVYPYPSWISGGTFEVRFRAFKAGEYTETTRAFQLNGQIPTDPVVLRTDKLENGTSRTANSVGNTAYTNVGQNTIWIGADAYTKLRARVINATTNQLVEEINFNTEDRTRSVAERRSLETNINGIAKIDFNLLTAPYNLTTDTSLRIEFFRQSQTTPDSVLVYTLVFDRTAPVLQSVTTRNLQARLDALGNLDRVNPWIRSGDTVGFDVIANEALYVGHAFNEVGFRAVGSKASQLGANCSQWSTQNYLDLTCSGLAFQNCRTSYLQSRQFTAELQLLAANETLKGVYTPALGLEDLAGNRTFVANRASVRSSIVNFLGSNDVYRSANLAGVDTSFLINGTLDSALTVEQRAIRNGVSGLTDGIPTGYPYSSTPRGRSVDFTLMVDNTVPEKQEWNLRDWGVSQKVADTVCVDANGVVLSEAQILGGLGANGASNSATTSVILSAAKDLSGFFTRVNGSKCIVVSDLVGQNISTITNRTSVADGINADSVYPEIERMGLSGETYVVRGGKVTLRGSIERNQRITVFWQRLGTNPSGELILSQSISSQTACARPSVNSGLVADTVSPSTRGSIVVKFAEVCQFAYDFVFPGSGSQTGMQADDGYAFQFVVTDLAGNLPTGSNFRSGSVTVWDDRVGISGVGLDTQVNTDGLTYASGSRTVGAWDQFDTTNDTALVVTANGEISADSVFGVSMRRNIVSAGTGVTPVDLELSGTTVLRNHNNLPYSTRVERVVRGGNVTDVSGTVISNSPETNKAVTRIALGQTNTSTRDDLRSSADNCITTTSAIVSASNPIPNRRIGLCNDGVYTTRVRQVDSAGNGVKDANGNWVWVERNVEKDAVAPGVPNVLQAQKQGSFRDQNLALDIQTEAYTALTIRITYPNGEIKVFGELLGQNGRFTKSSYLNLACGNQRYIVSFATTDRAGNQSTWTTDTVIQTDECGVCYSGTASGWYQPIRNINFVLTSDFYDTRQWQGKSVLHGGIDLAAPGGDTFTAGEPIVAAQSGTVRSARFDRLAYGYYVIVDHANGYSTYYAHMREWPAVTEGQTVTENTILGYVGNTGNSFGAHLHFEIRLNNNQLNPEQFLNVTGGTQNASFREQYCKSGGQDGGEAQDLYDGLNYEKLGNREVVELTTNLRAPNNISKTATPTPRLTSYKVESDTSGTKTISLFGVGVPKNATTQVKQKSMIAAPGRDMPYITELGPYNGTVQHSEVRLVRLNDNGSTTDLGTSKWNDSINLPAGEKGRFAFQNPTGEQVQVVPEGRSPDYGRGQIADKDWVCAVGRVWADYEKVEYRTELRQAFSVFGLAVNIVPVRVENKTIQKVDDAWARPNKENCVQIFARENVLEEEFVTGLWDKNKMRIVSQKKHGQYDNSKVWIVTHGQLDDAQGWVYEAATKFSEQNPQDIVLTLEWVATKAYLGAPIPTLRDQELSQIAEVVVNKLKLWGFSSQNAPNLTVVGHSMGTLLGATISHYLDNNANLIALDPPQQMLQPYRIKDTWYCEVAGILGTVIAPGAGTICNQVLGNNLTSFDAWTRYTRAFVGDTSISGDETLAGTANETITIKFGDRTLDYLTMDLAHEHGWVTKVFVRFLQSGNTFGTGFDFRSLQGDSQIANNTFNNRFEYIVRATDDEMRDAFGVKTDYGGAKFDSGEYITKPQSVMFRYNGGYQIKGTNMDKGDAIVVRYLDGLTNQEVDVYTNAGSDIVLSEDAQYDTITKLRLKDMANGDKISLSRFYKIGSTGFFRSFTVENGEIKRGALSTSPTIQNNGVSVMVLEGGSNVGNFTAQKLNQVLNSAGNFNDAYVSR